jgi:hypothetical protein
VCDKIDSLKIVVLLARGIVFPDKGVGCHQNMSECGKTVKVLLNCNMCRVLDECVDNNLIDMHGASNNVKLTRMFYYQGSPIHNLIKSSKWTKTWCAHEVLV